MDLTIPLIEIEGPPFERGIQYGQKARERINTSVDIYKNLMATYGCPWDTALRLAGEFTAQIEQHDADFLDELNGIAEGSGQRLEAIIVINCRSELMFGHDWEGLQPGDVGRLDAECTGIIAMPGATRDNRLLHGQNWDWRKECIDSAIVLRVVPDQGPCILTFVEAGGLARCGLNSAGVAVTANGLESNLDFDRSGVPLSIIRRAVLQSRTLYEALEAIISCPRAVSNNMMLSAIDAQGAEAINLETSPEQVFYLYPENGVLTHANHFESPVAQMKLQDIGIADSICSLYRSVRARALVEQKIGAITVQDIRNALHDTFGSPRAICRAPVKGRRGNFLMTVASIIMDTGAGSMYVCPSPHDHKQFTEYSVTPGSEPVAAAL